MNIEEELTRLRGNLETIKKQLDSLKNAVKDPNYETKIPLAVREQNEAKVGNLKINIKKKKSKKHKKRKI